MRILIADDDPQILRALRITLTARGYDVETASDGTEALRLGVAHEAVDAPLARALELAHDMAAHCSPTSMAHIKQRLWTSRSRTLDETVVEVDAVLDDFLSSDDFREGVASFVERRTPHFRGLSRPL